MSYDKPPAIQIQAEAQKAASEMAEADKQAREIAERAVKAAQDAASQTGNQTGWSGQRR
jgi:hypothetical protein